MRFPLALLVVAATCNGFAVRNLACQVLDIVFVIDSSQSVGPQNFETIKQFAVNVTQQFQVDSAHTQFSLVTFNSIATTRFRLAAFNNVYDLDQAIMHTEYTTGNSNAAGAFLKVRDEVYTLVGGDRPNAPNAIIYITDGVSSGEDPAPRARILRAQPYSATILSVGVRGTNGDRQSTNYDQLMEISGAGDLVIHDVEYEMLSNLAKVVAQLFPC